ncbi:MAG: right-handed parallel beta-helix repeat-containing protein [Ruminococcus sp.]|nr:right-handed parallel beta-helix repeat-containing protein [Ruminococcus sp.]
MKNSLFAKRAAAAAFSAVMSVTAATGTLTGTFISNLSDTAMTAVAAESSVKVLSAVGYGEGMYATWSSVSGASGYNVYVDGTKIDSMLIRQYAGYMRADAVGLKAGSHTMKIVPVINGSEDGSKAGQATANATAHKREGFGFKNGTSSGAYNEDGTLKSNATVVYVTNANKDSVTVSLPDKNGNNTQLTGVQNIITNLKSNTKVGPVCIRFIGNITDPSVLTKGDLYVDTATCGLTIEGIGSDATFNGFGLVLKNTSNCEIRNLGFMNCNSNEGDDCGLQQGNDHIWVHNCDFFYGDAGSDADQKKGDGALDTKKSTYVTHSFNHFWDNGKCNLQGMKDETTSNYITYHHNWYDHSDSRHPRIRTCSVHCYNNYFDGNAKYGVGVTMGASCFVENNYFRSCAKPMLISMQGTDIAEGTAGATFSSEDGGVIKSFGNYMTSQKAYVTYQQNSTEFDAYEASSRNEKVPANAKAKQGGTTYNNFDTDSSIMYSYTPDSAENVPAIVMAGAGRVDGGDFKWTFDNSVDDKSSDVNEALKSALVSYKDKITAIGSGFKEDNTPAPTVTTTTVIQPVVTTTQAPVVTDIATTTTTTTTSQGTYTPPTTNGKSPVYGEKTIFASPDGGGDGKSVNSPTDVLTAIKNVQAGGYIYLLEGTYKYTNTINIEESNSGAQGQYKTIAAYPGAKVTFDFTGQAVDASARGFVLDGSYWHFYGFTIANAGDNGMLLSGDNNIIEMMVFEKNQDTGLQISRLNGSYNTIAQWPTNNLVKNCTSRNNCDDATMENADGFAAKLTCGEGNVFDGCIAYNNSDDGWDLYAKEATGPIGVVTIKNCIAFRNGFTEYGKGYGDCDGNGFKLGGGGVGTRHVVENCLAFENLNCGFTDNNNPKFGDMKNCTAYNNGIGGKGKANYMVYRCDTSATFDGMMSYTNTSKVSKTNAAGIKLANDKFVGNMTNSIYYNSKYYFAKSSTTMTNGAKLGDVVTPADSDFITLNVPAMGTDFHKEWRNEDGSPKPAGFAETNGTYKSLGYHMASGISQSSAPAVYGDGQTPPPETTTTASETTTTTTTTTTESTTTTTTTTAPETTTTTTASATATTPVAALLGDVNLDKKVTIADAVAILQYVANKDKYALTPEAVDNADVYNRGDGVTARDALTIQKLDAGVITDLPEV